MTPEEVERVAQIIRTVDGNHDLGAAALAEAILAALAAAGLVVCADNEANRAGEKVRFEQARGGTQGWCTRCDEQVTDTDAMLLGLDQDGLVDQWWVAGDHPNATYDPLYRLVPLDEGTDR